MSDKAVKPVQRDAKGRIMKGSSANPTGNNRYSGEIARFKAAVEADLPEIYKQTIKQALEGCVQSQSLLYSRLIPQLKPSANNVSLSELSVDAVSNGIAEGSLSLDDGTRLGQLMLSLQSYQNNESLQLQLDSIQEQLQKLQSTGHNYAIDSEEHHQGFTKPATKPETTTRTSANSQE